MEVSDPQSVSYEIWDVHVLEGFKSLTLIKFDACSDPYEQVASINTQMVII